MNHWSGYLMLPLTVGAIVLVSWCIEHFHMGPYQ